MSLDLKDFSRNYSKQIDERTAAGIPPLPLSAEDVKTLCQNLLIPKLDPNLLKVHGQTDTVASLLYLRILCVGDVVHLLFHPPTSLLIRTPLCLLPAALLPSLSTLRALPHPPATPVFALFQLSALFLKTFVLSPLLLSFPRTPFNPASTTSSITPSANRRTKISTAACAGNISTTLPALLLPRLSYALLFFCSNARAEATFCFTR